MEFFKLSSQKLILMSFFLLLLGGCSIFQPFVDKRRNPGAENAKSLYIGPSKPRAPVICYNPLFSSDAEIQELADKECIEQETGTYAEFDKKTYFDGRLLLPAQAYYKCKK